jgi:hypothetical protein
MQWMKPRTALWRAEALLRGLGFTNPDVRSLVGFQIGLALAGSLLVLAVSGLAPWAWHYSAGAVLAVFNFVSLSRIVMILIQAEKGAVATLLLIFYAKLAVTGLALYGLIVWADASLAALLAGLSSVLAGILAWAVFRFTGNKV